MADVQPIYDAFISYCRSDAPWVATQLLPALEQASLRVCLDKRDFDIGVPRLVNIERATSNSRCTLLVLSPDWMASEWAEFAALLVQTSDPAARQRRLLPIVLRPCQPPNRIAMLSYADCTQPELWDVQLQRVVAAVRGELHLAEVGPLLGGMVRPEGVPFFVPFPRNPHFVGRSEELLQLHTTLIGPQPVGIHPAGLAGMGGIGKTQLAVEYAYRYRDAYPDGIFWINAATPLVQALAQLGQRLHPETTQHSLDDQLRAAISDLQSRPQSLLILDNVADPAELNRPIRTDMVLTALSCRILFTTRLRNLDRFKTIEVAVLPEDMALQLLLRHPARQAIVSSGHAELPEARTICATLGYLPLALEIAGTHLGQRPTASLRLYHEELLQRGALPVLDDPRGRLRSEDLPTRHNAAVTATLRSQWDTLQNHNAQLLLRVAGLLPEAAQLPIARLGLLAGLSSQEEGWFAPSPLMSALEELEAASLVEHLKENHVRLHPLVHEFAALQTPASSTPEFRERCATNLALAYDDIAIMEEQSAWRGVDALQDDLAVAIDLLAAPEQAVSAAACEQRLQDMLRLLQREAHNLRDWDQTQRPAFFAQQIHNRATSMGRLSLAARAAEYLGRLDRPHLRLAWRSGVESPDLELILVGHSAQVADVAVLPDGGHAISASDDRTLKIWNLQTGQEVRTLVGHDDRVNSVAVTPDGQRAVSASWDGKLKVWDLQTGQELATLAGYEHSARQVAVTPDGRYAVSSGTELDDALKVWDLQSGREVRAMKVDDTFVTMVAITPDGRRILCSGRNKGLQVWDFQTGQLEYVAKIGSGTSNGIGITHDSRYALVASDRTLIMWDIQARQEVQRLVHNDTRHTLITCTAITPDEQYAISSAWDNTIKIWDLRARQVIKTIYGHGALIRVVVTPNGRHLLSVASYDPTVKVWSLRTEPTVQPVAGHLEAVRDIATSPSGQWAVSAAWDMTLKMWDIQTGQEIRTLKGVGGPAISVTVSPDSQLIVASSVSGPIRVWDAQTAKELRGFPAGRAGIVEALTIAPDGRYLVSVSNDTTKSVPSVALLIWDLKSRQLQHTLPDQIRGAIMLDSRSLVSTTQSGSLRIWDIQTGQLIRQLAEHGAPVTAITLTSDNQHVISGARDGTLKVWDLNSGLLVHTLTGHTGEIKAVTVVPGHDRAVSLSSDRTLRLWDLRTSRELAMVALDGELTSIAVTLDGDNLLVGDRGGNVYCLHYWEVMLDKVR